MTTRPSRGIKNKGSLTRVGYREKKDALARHRALDKAVRKYGYKKTMDKVNDLYVLNKNKANETVRNLQADKNFLRKHARSLRR
jgi:hypothetical protein